MCVLAQAGLRQLWWACGANCAHAPGAGGEPTLDFRATLFARPELLHAATRPRGTATGHLHRLVDAPHLGRRGGGRAVCAAFAVHPGGAVVGVCGLWRFAAGGGVVLRHQACGHRHRAARGIPHRLQGVEEPGALGAGLCRTGGHRGVQVAVSCHCGRGCLGGHPVGALGAWRVQSGWRACRIRPTLWPCVDRRPHPHA